VVVLSNNDGCVVARSPEVTALGIKMGVPLFQIQSLIRQHGIQVYSSNYSLYGDMSGRVMEVLKQFTPDLEIYSIDEAFLDFSGFAQRDLCHYAQQIRQTVRQWTGIPVSIGIGKTKTLAKLANAVAKKLAAGVFTLTALNTDQILAQTQVRDIWGIGRNYARSLHEQGIVTALQLRDAPPEWIRQEYGVVMLRLVRELQGTSCLPLEQCPQPKQSITVSRSFGQPVTSLAHLQEAIATYTSRAAEKLRREQLLASAITIFVMGNRFQPHAYSNATTLTLPVATSSTPELLHVALQGAQALQLAHVVVAVVLVGVVDHEGRDEQHKLVRVGHALAAAEHPIQTRHVAQQRHLAHAVLLVLREDAADHHRAAVLDQHLGLDVLGVDGKAGRCGLADGILVDVQIQNDAAFWRDLRRNLK
jgi:DNA polymerase V